jgi:cation-transporting ATPase E
LVSYLLARHAFDLTLEQARTVTVATVVVAGLAIVIALEDEPGLRRLAVCGLCALMALGFVVFCAVPAGRDYFELESPTGSMLAAWGIGAAVAVLLLAAALRLARRLDRRAAEATVAVG